MKPYIKRCGTIFAIAIILGATINVIPFLNPSQPQLANALDFELSDFNCIAVVGNIGDNICTEDNGVTNNNIVNHNTFFDCTATVTQGNTATSESDNADVTQDNTATSESDNADVTQGNTGSNSDNFNQSNAATVDQSDTFNQSNAATVDQSDTFNQSNTVEQCNMISLPL